MRASIYKWKCHVIVRYSVVFIQDSLYCALPIGLFLVECLGPPVAELKLILCTACLRNVKVPIPYLAHKEVKVLVAQLCLTFCNPLACQDPLSMGFSRQECWSGQAILFFRESSQPRGELDLLHCRHILYHLSHWGSPDSSLLRA